MITPCTHILQTERANRVTIDVYFDGPMIYVLVDKVNSVSVCKTNIYLYT